MEPFLEALYQQYNDPKFMDRDPIEFVHRYKDPLDQELVALISSQLAYGNVTQIKASVSKILDLCAGRQPSLLGLELKRRSKDGFAGALSCSGFVHRFNGAADVLALMRIWAEMTKRHGSLGGYFKQVAQAAPYSEGWDWVMKTSIDGLADFAQKEGLLKDAPKATFFLSSPSGKSACKRWCMFLRWMVRKDKVDLGLWKWADPSELFIPLDTHTGRISRYLGLTSRKASDWKTVNEVTHGLKAFDPTDPVKFDFALSRLGILDLCQKRYRVEICTQCQLRPVCQFAKSSSLSRSASTQSAH